jgi:predicted MFS family arabinose efflux permease
VLQLRTRSAQAGEDEPSPRSRPPADVYRWRLVWMLAITQTAGYGVLFYSFSVFLVPTAAELHTSTTTVTGAWTSSLLAGAAAAFPIGRWLDRHGGRALMSGGSIAATLLVLAWSQVSSVLELYLVWIALGVVSVGVLYDAAFPVVISWFDPARRARALLAITVVAGFASTIFLPLAGALNDAVGWRDAVLILAVIHGTLTIPLHFLIRRPPARKPGRSTDSASERAAVTRAAFRDPVFWLLAASFVAQACAVAAVSVLLVTMLRDLGHSPGFSATVAGLLGVLSVTGRLATTAAGRRWSVGGVTAAAFVVQTGGVVLLPVAGRSVVGAIGCVLAFGFGLGVSTIARPAMLADRYGTSAYATLAAAWVMPLTLVKALGPLGTVLLWHVAGLTVALDAAAACCLLGAVGLVWAGRTPSVARVE